MFHSNSDAVSNHVFESEDIRQFVTLAREKKQVVIDAAKDLLELPVLTAYDSDTTSRKMKTQDLYSDFINRDPEHMRWKFLHQAGVAAKCKLVF